MQKSIDLLKNHENNLSLSLYEFFFPSVICGAVCSVQCALLTGATRRGAGESWAAGADVGHRAHVHTLTPRRQTRLGNCCGCCSCCRSGCCWCCCCGGGSFRARIEETKPKQSTAGSSCGSRCCWVVVVVVPSRHGSARRPSPSNPPQGAAVVVVGVHTSLATSAHVGEPHEKLNRPQVTSHWWEQAWPLHWAAHTARGSVKRQQMALDQDCLQILAWCVRIYLEEASAGLTSMLKADTKPTKGRSQKSFESIFLSNCCSASCKLWIFVLLWNINCKW